MPIMPELDSNLCDGCGLCISACHDGGIARYDSKVKIGETENCDYCGVCEAVCPNGAIKCYYEIVSA
ncbi:MAG: 4Fe-4S binding protein [Chloroflexota bacterium]